MGTFLNLGKVNKREKEKGKATTDKKVPSEKEQTENKNTEDTVEKEITEDLSKALDLELEKQRKRRLQVKALVRISYQSRTIDIGQSFKLVSYNHFNPAQMEWEDDLEDEKIKEIVNKINKKHEESFDNSGTEG